jgi:peptidoglycan/LPS O-acetylase OafA/YrhL
VTKTIAWILLIILVAILLWVSVYAPYYLSDDGNKFFKDFVNQELLSVMGVVVTITLASAANLHLEINKLQDEIDEDFAEARTAIRLSAYSLIGAFIVAGALVMIKPTAPEDQMTTALFNSGAIVILVFSAALLADLTAAVFDIPPLKELKRRQREAQSRGEADG